MPRPVDPAAGYRVRVHATNGYRYASTQPGHIDPVTGLRYYRRVHWGTVDEQGKFTPGPRFFLASPQERAQLVFPADWDLSDADHLTGLTPPVGCGECRNRLYGDVWLLEQIADFTGVRHDLQVVFDGNHQIVDDILTLAMFPYLTRFTYNRVARWQRVVKTPSGRDLTPAVITRLTQSITERHRIELMRRRAARLGKDELCAVDSTTRSAYGDHLADIRWGKNKDRLPLPQTTEVVVYTLSSHTPVYYRTFPGNMPDSRSLDVVLADLDHAGFDDLILITDRGYDTLRNLERYITRGQPMIMCVKTGQREAAKVILGLPEFTGCPDGMRVDPDARIYHAQHDIDYHVGGTPDHPIVSDRLKLNVYFDPIRRGHELTELDITLTIQQDSLDHLIATSGTLDDTSIKRDYSYHNVTIDPDTRQIVSYTRDEKKITKAKSFSGFFTIMTHGVDFDAMQTHDTYKLRDEQEKYFQQMKSQMQSDRQRNWSEEGKTGRLLILFVSLILGSHVRHIWKTTRLHDLFSSSLDILDEMRPIRMIEHPGHPPKITPFVGAQLDICQEFGFDTPQGCAPTYTSQHKPKRKPGRPPKPTVEHDS